MNNLSPEQRQEVAEMQGINNTVLISSLKETMHEIIDPLKESVNKALGNYDVLNQKIEENVKKIEQVFIFHNKNEEIRQNQKLEMLEIKNEAARAHGDIDNIAEKLRENKIADVKVGEKFDVLEKIVLEAQTSAKTLKWVGGILLTLMGLLIAVLEMA